MTHRLLSSIALIALCTATGASAITATGNATATIRAAITATQDQQMSFGTVSAAASSAVVTLSSAGTRTSTLSYYGTAAPGIFTITAEPSTALSISFSNGTLTSSSNTMTVSNFTSTSNPASYTTDSSGNLTLNVGADLSVGSNQPSGTYSGTYSVTLNY